ncbi:MAG: YbfB/YjiJ family MFS transporter [Gammaproteobacteria bacterium]|nr:YbfB/YjiJ family MFS transporter [Gammaproteobacteria bacterium]
MNLPLEYRWIAAATLVMAAALGIGRFAYTPLLPQMVSELGWRLGAAGDLASANYLGYMIGAFLAPSVFRTRHVRLWVALSFMASVATTYLGAQITQFSAWFALRFLAGVSSAFCLVIITTHLIHVLSNLDKSSLGNVHFSGIGVGILVCMLSLSSSDPVQVQWARLGGIAAVLMAGAWMLLADQPLGLPDSYGGRAGSRPDPAPAIVWRLIIGYGFFGFGYVICATFIVVIAESISGISNAGLVWWAVGLSLVPSVYLWQLAANRWGITPALLAAYLVQCVGVLIAAVSGNIYMLLLACVLLGSTFAAITALGISAARAAMPNRVAFAVSAMTLSFALGQLLGPALAGRMADAFGNFFWAFMLAAVLLFAAAALTLQRRPRT